jgi:hypothetical protein
MKQRARLHWFGISCLVVASCTQLQDPNQVFGGVDKGGQTSALTAGNAGRADMSGAGIAGSIDNAGADSNGGNSPGAGTSKGGIGGDAGASDTDCVDEKGFDGLGCYSCAPTDSATLENACTSSSCVPFDRKRLTLLGADGKLPPLPGPAAAGGAGGAGGAPSSAGAGGATSTGKACADVAKNGGKLVYITGSSAAGPLLTQIAQQLASQNIYIVYESTGSCVGVDAVLNGTPMITSGPTAPATSATYWDTAASPGVACDLPADGVTADIGASDVFAQSCAGFEFANLENAGVRDAHGPIQTMTFAVPTNSAYTEISAEAAYFVFGFGANSGVKDAAGALIWNNEDSLFKRSATSGTQVMLAATIGVPAGVWRGKPQKGSPDVAAALIAAGQKQETANAALGILAADYIDTKLLRAQLRMLAFQDTNQHCAVTPDSTVNAKDKANVRDGHYPVWGPLHLLLRVDSQGNPLNPANRKAVSDIVGYLSGTKALPNGVQLIDLYAQSGLVPECAMHVSRTKDGGNIVPYRPPASCSCLFDKKLGLTPQCAECSAIAPCAAGETCSLGYCEPE